MVFIVKKRLSFLLLFIFILIGCNTTNINVSIKSVELDISTIPNDEINVDDFNLNDIKLLITYTDNSIETKTVDKSMISDDDFNSLSSPGIKEIEVSYKTFELIFVVTLVEIEVGDSINVFAFNDTHGAFNSDSEYPGFEKVNTIANSLEKENGQYIKIANGDIFQGSYVSNIHYGKPMVEAMNKMDLDAFVIGNHEFDWGINKIQEYKDGNLENGEADFEFLAANIVHTSTNETLEWTKDYIIVNNNGYKVAIIGVIQEGLETSIASDKIAGYKFLDPVTIVSNLSKKLRTELDVDMVLVSIHGYSSYTNTRLASLSNDNRIDGIICGHTHQEISEFEMRNDGFNIPVVQSYTKNISVGEIVYSINNNKFEATINHYNPFDYGNDSKIIEVIDKYKNTIDEGERVIGYTTEDLYRYRLGAEMVKAMKEKYSTDVAIINTAGVRDDIGVGNIKVKKIYEVFPFDNKVILTSMSGEKLKNLYENNSSYLYFSSGFNPYELDYNKTYTISTIDFVFTSTYYKNEFSNSTPNNTNVFMRDIFIEYIESWVK